MSVGETVVLSEARARQLLRRTGRASATSTSARCARIADAIGGVT